MSLKSRVARLEKRLPPPPPPESADPRTKQIKKRFQQVENRLACLVESAMPLLTEGEKGPVEAALKQWLVEQKGPYRHWFDDLASGTCRLPELPPPVMKELLVAWLSPDVDSLCVAVCRQCGMEYPRHRSPPYAEWKRLPGKVPFQDPPPWYDLPEFFQSCPGCGASLFDIDWAHFNMASRPWMKMDGYVGRQERQMS